jgi:hypothetical protein
MNSKQEGRTRYLEGVRGAMLEHAETTEAGIRKLKGVKPERTEKLVADLHKQHEELLRRIDREINLETVR